MALANDTKPEPQPPTQWLHKMAFSETTKGPCVPMGQVLLPPGGACLSGPCNSGQAPPRATMCSLPPLCYRNSQIIPSAPPRALWLWDFNTSCLRASASRPQKLCPAPCKDAEPAPHYPLALGGVLAVVSPTSRTLLGPRERKQQSILQHQLLGRYNSGLR